MNSNSGSWIGTRLSSLGKWFPPLIYSILLVSSASPFLFVVNNSYLFEVALLVAGLFAFFGRDSIAGKFIAIVRNPSIQLRAAILVVTGSFLLGLVVTQDFVAAYGDYRSNLVFIAGFAFAFAVRDSDPMMLVRLGILASVVSIFAWFEYSASQVETITKFGTPYTGCLVAIIAACQSRRALMGSASLALMVGLAAISFYRTTWVATGCAALYLISCIVIYERGRSRGRMIAGLLLSIVLAGIALQAKLAQIESFFYDDEGRYIQSIGKTEDLIGAFAQGDALQEGDATHLMYFQFTWDEPWKLILPHGLGYRYYTDNIDPYFNKLGGSSTIDSLFFYLTFHYGLILSIPALIWLGWTLKRFARRRGWLCALSVGGVLGISLLTDGGHAVIIMRAFWLGALVGMIAEPFRIKLTHNRV